MSFPVTRFAPSPTGFLHFGHAASALFAWERAQAGVGRFLLRIEDIDRARCRPEFTSAILEDLRWLGLAWNGAIRVQSEHLAEYAAALAQLQRERLLYPCFCTRAEIAQEVAASGYAPHGPDGTPLYPGTCRQLPADEQTARIEAGAAHAWRLDMAAAVRRAGPLTFHEAGQGLLPADPAAFGDVVLGRKDVPASYHLCVAHDDAAQGVTLVTRALDLSPATAVHRLLQALLGWPEPSYAHHPLLLDADGRRLAKRDGAVALRDLRAAGMSAEAVLASVRDLKSAGFG